MSIEDALAARGTGNILSNLQCYRCWAKHGRTRSRNITMHEGTAYCLDCVDERLQEQVEYEEVMRQHYAEMDVFGDGMTISDLYHWIKKHVFRRPG